MSEQNYIDIKNPQSINGQDQFDITSPPKTDLLKDQLIIPTKSCRQQKLDSKKEEVEEENKSSFINEETYKQSFEDNTNEEIELLELKSENENEKLLFMQRQKTQSSGDDFPFANDSFSKDKTFFDRNTQCVGQFSNTQDFQQNDIDYQSQYPIQHDLIQYDQNYENQNEYENIKPQTEAPQSLEYQSEDNFQMPQGFNTDFLYSSQQNQIKAQSIFSSFGQNQNTQNEKLNCQDQLNKHYTLSTAIAQSDQDSCSNKLLQKGDSDLLSLIMKENVVKSSSMFPPISQNNQNDKLIQKLGMLEIQNKEQEERIQNLQKLNDQLMSAITDLNGNDQSKQKYQREKELLQKQHDKEISDYMFQIKDLKNKLELQKSQMNEKAAEYEKDKMLLEKQLQEEEKSYQQKLQQYKEEKDSINAMLKDYEQMRQKNQEVVQANLENKIRVLEEVIEKQKQEAEERTGQLANDTEKNIQKMKQIHENEKNILMNKISSLQQEKKLIEQQSEYNFKLFNDLRNKSENQQDGLYNELDKTRKLICGLEQKIIEKDSIIQIQQQKIDGNETVLKLREKNYEESLKAFKNQNDQLMEQIKKQQHELKLMQFQIQEKSFELTDKSKQLKKQIWNEKKKAEQMEEVANRIKDDYTKKNSFVIQELLMKEEKIKKLNNQIHKQSAIQNQIAQLNYNSLSNNNNNNTSYSFINNTNLSNLIQNPNLSLIQQNMSCVNRPSQRQQDRNQVLSLSNNVNLNMIMNQENFNSSDNLNVINNHSLSKSPKIQVNKASIMSQCQDSYSVPTSNRNFNNVQSSKNNQIAAISSDNLSQSNQNFNATRIQHLRSISNYQSETINKNNSQISHDKSNIENFNSCQVVNNLLSINSPSNTTTLPQITNDFMSPQSQKLDLSRSEPQTMRGVVPTMSQNQIQTIDQGKKEEAQKNKRSLSQAVTPLTTGALNKSFQKVINQQNQQKSNQQRNQQNKSGSQSPLAIQQKEIIGNNLTLITYDASQQKNSNNKKSNNKDDIHNTSINTPISNKRGAVNNNQNRSVSPIHNQSVNSCYSQKDVEKTKNASNRRNISVDQSKSINKVVGVTLNNNRDFNQNHLKNLSVSATPMSSVNLNILMNQQNENIENMNVRSNQMTFIPENNSQKQQIFNLTPNKQNNSINQNYSKFMQNNQNLNQDNSFSKDRPNLVINLQQHNLNTNANTQQNDNCFNNQYQNYEQNQQINQIQSNFIQNNLNMGFNQNNSFSKENNVSRPNLIINLQQNQNDINNQINCKQQFENCFNNQNYQLQQYSQQQQNSIQMQQKRDITFGTPITENFYSEMSQKFQKTQDDNQQFSQQQQSKFQNDQQISKIRKILNQFNFIQQAQLNKSSIAQAACNQKENQAINQQQLSSNQPQQQFKTNQKEIEAIFFQQMKEALQTYPEMIEQSNGILRTSMESKDMKLALNGLKEIIQKININEKEKKELQIEITSLQSKCSLEKASLQNIPTNTVYNYDTQNNIQNSSIGDSKVNQIIMENLQIKTSENSFCGVNISEKENAKATPVSLELNNKFKPITSMIHNGNPQSVNNLSINLSGLKSAQFQQIKEEKNNKQSRALQQKSDYLNDYNSNIENQPYKNNLQVQQNSKTQTNINNKSSNISYNQFNSARTSNKVSDDQNQNPSNTIKTQNKHSASISITIQANNCMNDQSPQMQRMNSGLSQTIRQVANVNNNLLNLSNNKINKTKTTSKI